MAALGSIFVRLGLNTQAFERGLERSRSLASRFSARIRKSLSPIRLAFGALGAATAGLAFAIKSASDYETALVGVIKTTGLVGDELAKFEAGIGSFTRVFAASKREMLGLAEAAGQMNVRGADNLVKVAETMAKLAKSSNVVGEEGLTSIARILNVTGESIGTIGNFASALVAVGQASAANEAEILNMTLAFAGATKGFQVSSAELIGIGSALKSLGQKAEGAASTLSRTFSEISTAIQVGGKPAAAMAAHLGLTVSEMRTQFKKSASDTLLLFLKRLKEKGDNAILTLKALNLASTEDSRNLRVLAGAHEEVAKAIALATDEHRKNTALNKEAAAANSTFASQLIIFKNNLIAVATTIGAYVLPSLTSILNEINFVFNSGERKLEMFTLFIKAKFGEIELIAEKSADTIAWVFSEAFDKVLDALEGKLMGGFRKAFRHLVGPVIAGISDYAKFGDVLPRIDYQRQDFPKPPEDEPNVYQQQLEALMKLEKDARIAMEENRDKLWGADGFPKNDAASNAINEALAKANKDAANELPTGDGKIDNSLFSGAGKGLKEAKMNADHFRASLEQLRTVPVLGADEAAWQLNERLAEIRSSLQEGLITKAQAAQFTTDFALALTGAEQALTELQIAAMANRDELQTLGRDTWSGFFDSLEEFAKTGKANFKAFANDIIILFAKIQLKAMATRAILSLSKAGGMTGSFFGGVATAFKLGTRADGGPVSSGGAYIVGERGPEIFSPKRNGTIVPNEALGTSGGSTAPAVIIQQENTYNGGASAADLVEFSKRTTANSIQAITGIISNGGQPARQFAQ